MELERLIEGLAEPAAYPAPVDEVEVIQTHASVVFLAGEHAYKIKKPVDFGFLDYSTRELRRRMCAAEVELNARLAPDVYLGVVPVAVVQGRLRMEGEGDEVEVAVKMRRLPDAARLGYRLEHDRVERDRIDQIASRIAEFHRVARRGPDVAAVASFEVLQRNCRENFEQLRPHVGKALSPGVYARLQAATEAELERRRELIEARQALACETHGDLRLEHVYLFDDRTPPHDLQIVDCIEFNERFRYADPVSDIAFLVMDMQAHGFRQAAEHLARAYFSASGDQAGATLLPLYTAYRATVRGKVRAMQAAEAEVPEAERARALELAGGHLLQALAELEGPERAPALLITCGLPGTGKSVLARSLAELGGFEVIRSDVVRKQLAGMAELERAGDDPASGIYAAEWTERTYDACLEEARRRLFEGQRVIVDATFRNEAHRLMFWREARRWCVPFHVLYCVAPAPEVKQRLDERSAAGTDASDADWGVYLHMETVWEPLGPRTAAAATVVDTRGDPDAVARRTWAQLYEARSAGKS